jgi:predicted metal-dependent hydrolase
MNHSHRFWRHCERLCPRMGEARAWLKAHGASLHRYGKSRTIQ